tara:strand:+ start:453 stop:641 length:189 start_codon:yes stop_codon:yes gene_type:complete
MDMDIDYTPLPQHIRAGVQRYVEHGADVGGFLTAVLSNNLCESFGRADETNRAYLARLEDAR